MKNVQTVSEERRETRKCVYGLEKREGRRTEDERTKEANDRREDGNVRKWDQKE